MTARVDVPLTAGVHPTDFVGRQMLFARDFSNTEPQKEPIWSFDAEGDFNAVKDMNLVTKAEYANSALDFEFRDDSHTRLFKKDAPGARLYPFVSF